jgi:hypothetical protein
MTVFMLSHCKTNSTKEEQRMRILSVLFAILIVVVGSFAAGHYVGKKGMWHEVALQASLSLSQHVRMREALLKQDHQSTLSSIDTVMLGNIVAMNLYDERSSQMRAPDEQRQRERSLAAAKSSWLQTPPTIDPAYRGSAISTLAELCVKNLQRPCPDGEIASGR